MAGWLDPWLSCRHCSHVSSALIKAAVTYDPLQLSMVAVSTVFSQFSDSHKLWTLKRSTYKQIHSLLVTTVSLYFTQALSRCDCASVSLYHIAFTVFSVCLPYESTSFPDWNTNDLNEALLRQLLFTFGLTWCLSVIHHRSFGEKSPVYHLKANDNCTCCSMQTCHYFLHLFYVYTDHDSLLNANWLYFKGFNQLTLFIWKNSYIRSIYKLYHVYLLKYAEQNVNIQSLAQVSQIYVQVSFFLK